MTTLISSNSGGVAADDVLGYETTREGRNIVHDLIGGGIAVALIAPRPRSGTLQYLFTYESSAWLALELHSEEKVLTLVQTDRPAVGMTYVVAGNVALALDDETRAVWILSVDFQEVQP